MNYLKIQAVLFVISITCSSSFIQSEDLKSCPQKCVNLGLCGCELSKVINSGQELTQEQANQLVSNVCALDLNSISEFKVKVCCECQRVTSDMTLEGSSKQTPRPSLPRVSLLLSAKCTNFTHEDIDVLPNNCGVSQSYEELIKPRIIRGNITSYHELPWMVQLVKISAENAWKMYCGGTIIAKRYILTAAHCIVSKNPTHVIVGLTDANEDTKTIDYSTDIISAEKLDYDLMKVRDHFVHPEYNPSTYKNDIALLRLEQQITMSPTAQPICLPVYDKYCTKLENVKLITSGWGIMEKGNLSDQLRHAEVPLVHFRNCKDIFKFSNIKIFRHVNICAGGESADICSGDSGGPLQAMIGSGDYDTVAVQFGVVSQGLENVCGRKGYPGVFTSVKRFLTWIIDTIAKKD